MFRLSSLYDSEEGPTIATGVLAVGISLLLSVGLYLIISAHSNSQAQQLQLAIAAIRKSQDEGISLNQALAELKSASITKPKTNTDTTPSAGVFDTVTVKGTSLLQGDVNTSKDVNVAGRVKAKSLSINGVNLDNHFIQNVSDDPQNSTAINVDEITVGTLSVSEDMNFSGGLSTDGDLSVSGGGDFGSDLTVAGLVDAQSLTVEGDAGVSGDLNVDGGLTTTSDSTFSGNVDAASISISGTDVNDLFIQNSGTPQDPSIDTTGNISAATLTSTGDTNVNGNLAISGTGDSTVAGNLEVSGTFKLGTSDINNLFIQNNPSSPQTSANINIDGDATVGNNLTVSGHTKLLSGYSYSTGTISQGTVGSPNVDDTNITGAGTTFISDMVGGTITYGDNNSTDTIADFTDATHLTSTTASTHAAGTTYEITWGGDLTAAGNIDASSLSIGGTNINTIFQPVGDYQPAGDYLVNGDDISVPDLTVTGNTHANGNDGSTLKEVDCTTFLGVPSHVKIERVDKGLVTFATCKADDGSSPGSAAFYDLAENFPSTQSLSAGDVVSIDPANAEYVTKSVGSNDKLAIGVVSTAPGYTLGAGGPGYPIALAGRVPVKVTDEGGAIAPGDYLTSSSTPGYAKKAAAGEKVIGQALAGFNSSSGTVMMFVNTTVGSAPQLALVQPAQNSAASFTSLNVSGPANLTDLTVSGLATVFNLTINGHIIGNDDTRGTVTVKAGDTTVHHDFTTAYDKPPVVVASPANHAVLYNVTPTATGFDITLTAPAAADTEFSYLVQE